MSKREEKSLNQKTSTLRILKWCHRCNRYFHGRYSICTSCVKQKRRDNEVCWDCRNPDCLNPVIPGGVMESLTDNVDSGGIDLIHDDPNDTVDGD